MTDQENPLAMKSGDFIYPKSRQELEVELKHSISTLESKIKALEQDLHRIACEISRLREQHHDDCKLVIELKEKIKELEERICLHQDNCPDFRKEKEGKDG